MAAAVVAIAHRLGLDVPGDLTVAGFDDTALATTIWPELTTVRQPIATMAETGVQFLVRQIRAKRDGVAELPQHSLMDFSLIRRQSDAAPRMRPPTKIARP
jgi:LacI family transcriptional regulator